MKKEYNNVSDKDGKYKRRNIKKMSERGKGREEQNKTKEMRRKIEKREI